MLFIFLVQKKILHLLACECQNMFCIDGASHIHGITSKCLHGCKFIFSFNFISGYDEIHRYEFKVLIRIFLIIIYYTFALHLARGFSFFFFFAGENSNPPGRQCIYRNFCSSMFNYWNLFYFVCSYFVPFFQWEKQWSNQSP